MEALIIGTGEAKYTRHPAPDQSTHTVIRDAVLLALADAQLGVSDVDGFAVSSFSLEPDRAIDLAWRLGLSLRWLMQDTNGGASGHNMLDHAIAGIERKAASVVVIVSGDVLSPAEGATLSANYNRATRDHLTPIGFSGPNSLFAMLTTRQMRKYGLEREDYGALVTSQRNWASKNPGAVYRTPLTLEEYMQAPSVADPLTRYDCVPAVAGATALVVAASERRLTGDAAVRVRALRQSFNFDQQQGDGLTTGLASIADDFWREGAARPQNVDLACIYDDYPAMVFTQLNDLAFVQDGNLKQFVKHRILDERFPVNTSGGMLSAGQAGPAGGLHAIVEAVRQLQHKAHGRQVPDARLAVATGYGMVLYRYGANAAAALLERVS